MQELTDHDCRQYAKKEIGDADNADYYCTKCGKKISGESLMEHDVSCVEIEQGHCSCHVKDLEME